MRNAAILLVLMLVAGCTEQQRARSFGGEATSELPACEKLVVATWKAEDLWFLTRPARVGDVQESYKFREDSSFGLLEGTVTVNEHITEACFADVP